MGINRFQVKFPPFDSPQANRNALLVCKLGTGIITLALRCRFNDAMMLTDGAI